MTNNTNLDINFVFDVIHAYATLHNILIGMKDVDVWKLLSIITLEAKTMCHPTRVHVHVQSYGKMSTKSS